MAAKDNESKALAPQAADGETGVIGYATGSEEFAAIIKENLGGGSVRVFDLPKIKVPAGGGQTWEVPTIDGPSARRTLSGVVVYWNTRRAMWKNREANGSPPDCSSADNINGVGDNGVEESDDALVAYNPDGTPIFEHVCETCPLNQWGTATRQDGSLSRGKACKEIRQLFVIQEGELLPYVIPLPPTSIQPAGQFFQRLASAALSYYAVEMNIGLEKVSGPPDYSRATFAVGRRLEPDELARIRPYREQLVPLLQTVDAATEVAGETTVI